ncbi:MAG TPA: Ldh family oxidoreductase [Dehalococcoidia bacterium]|nr:Ldh family oxidoreductase [Dehalococcoidia bacterium]
MATETLVRPEALRSFCARVLEKVNVPPEDAALAAEVLVDCDLRGIDTHGIMRLPTYVKYLQEGYYNPRPNIQIVRESSIHALFDGDRAMGFITSARAMQWCIDRASQDGFAMAGVRNSRHNGASATWSMMAARKDLIGFASTNVVPVMAPPGSYRATHGNNPISFAIPAGEEPMLVLDMATSQKAWGNVINYRREGKVMPLGWALDEEGNETTDPNRVRSLLPIGDGGFKGYGLSLVLDILCGVLTGANFARRFTPGRLDDGVGHFFMAIDPQLFMPLDEFKARVDETLREVRTAPRKAGVERIYIPGELESELKERRLRDGLPIPPGLRKELETLGQETGVPLEI